MRRVVSVQDLIKSGVVLYTFALAFDGRCIGGGLFLDAIDFH